MRRLVRHNECQGISDNKNRSKHTAQNTLKHLLIVNSKFIIKLKIALNGANMIKTTGLFKNSDKFCILSLSLSMNGIFSFIPLQNINDLKKTEPRRPIYLIGTAIITTKNEPNINSNVFINFALYYMIEVHA